MIAKLQTSLGRSVIIIASFSLIVSLLLTSSGIAQTDKPTELADSTTVIDSILTQIEPATDVIAIDRDNDPGGSILVRWTKSTDDSLLTTYLINRIADGEETEFKEIGKATPGSEEFFDGSTTDGTQYYYTVTSVSKDGVQISSTQSDPAVSGPQWFHTGRLNVLVGVSMVCFFIIFFIYQATSGKKIFIRKIAGLDAVDEAVGRATEMGKKIFFIPGTQDMNNVQTIAGLTILGRVAETAAQYETWLEVPVSRSMVLVTAKEIVAEAYSRAGRPDAFNEDQVHYLTDDQFGYAAGVDGMVVREKPATIFYMGAFYAESLILAETGSSIGAIQIAGTGMPSQLPFFIAACDYTLIGEELFAASAYLSNEPRQLGSLKGQDVAKGVILVALVVGIIIETFGIFGTWEFSSLFRIVN